jgi:hypothetical protein
VDRARDAGHADHLTMRDCGDGDAPRHRRVRADGGVADDGPDRAMGHTRDAEADGDFQELIQAACEGPGVVGATGRIAVIGS